MPFPWDYWEFIMLQSPRPGVLPQPQPSAADGEAVPPPRSHKPPPPPPPPQWLPTQGPHPTFLRDLLASPQDFLLLALEQNLGKYTSLHLPQNCRFQRQCI